MEETAPTRRSIVIASIVVFAIAVTVRVPSCYESFWVDELHSAWCVWDSLSDVFPRASVGHQSPFYFFGLWFWKQAVGESEVALRMSSVLAVAASCVVLTAGVGRWTRSLVAGATAGLVMAMESNTLFFGTELRPYAFVILFSSIALVCFLRLVVVASRHEDRRAWVGLVVAILLAVLCQPTAIGVLAWLPLVLFGVWLIRDRRQFLNFSLSDSFLMLSTAAVGFALWRVTLGETWHQRANWASFATATSVDQIWQVWDWTWLLLVPLATLIASALAARLRKTSLSIREVSLASLLLALIAVLATSLYWTLSRADWIPVWHRRYFIAALPVFACVVGGAAGMVDIALRPSRMGGLAAWVFAIVLGLYPAYQQSMFSRLWDYPVALVTRGENWRDAVTWVRLNSESKDLVFLDAGLVEANTWLWRSPIVPLTPNQRKYLVFPANGPYDVGTDLEPLDSSRLAKPWSVVDTKSRARRVIIITRRAAHQVRGSMPVGSLVLGFGNVSVIVQSRDLNGVTEIHPSPG